MNKEELLGAGEVGFAVEDVVGGGVDRADDGTVGVGGASRIGIVSEEILGAEFAVNAIEDGAEFLGSVGIEHGAAGGVGHGFEGVFTGGVWAVFVFYGAGGEGVGGRIGEGGRPSGAVGAGGAGGVPGARDPDEVER